MKILERLWKWSTNGSCTKKITMQGFLSWYFYNHFKERIPKRKFVSDFVAFSKKVSLREGLGKFKESTYLA